jgi:glycosyltransferase involved in cell wall biosynthesis
MIDVKELTIVVPTLNCRESFGFCLESIRPLQIAGAEIIVVDSYSKDGTAELGKERADRFLQVPAGNMYSAINAGLKAARGKWLSYINADDLLYHDSVLTAFEALPDNADLMYGNLDYIDGENRFLHSFTTPPPADLLPLAGLLINGVPPQGAFYRREVFEKLQGFNDKDFRLAGDFDFFIRANLAGFRFYHHKGPALAGYRMHKNQYSQTQAENLLSEGRKSIKANSINFSRKDSLSAKLRFKIRNFGNYIVRFLRASQLSGSLKFPGTMDY